MSLYPGNPRKDDSKYFLDDKALSDKRALKDSLAVAIEDAMADIYKKVKGEPLPATGKADRLLLFLAIARGILQYLEKHETDLLAGVKISHKPGPSVTHTVANLDLNIKMNK